MSVVSEVGRLIDEYRDQQQFPVSAAAVARRLGVSRSTIGKWYAGSVPRPEHLRSIATLIGVPYSRLTDAVLSDLGYYAKAGEDREELSAPKSVAEWDRRAAELQRGVRPLSDAEVVQALGVRPGESGQPLPGEVTGRARGGRRLA